MGTTAGELREMLVTAIEQVQQGKLDPSKAKAMANLAQQVNASLQVELDARKMMLEMQKRGATFSAGSLSLGEEIASPASVVHRIGDD